VAGRCRGMTSALQDLLERHVASGTVPGVVASLGTAEFKIVAAGAMSVGGAPMRADAIMRMKSMTKTVTTVAALRLVEAGRLRLDEPVERWLPELVDRLGTNFFVDPDGTVGVLLTQVEMGERMQILLDEFQALPEAA
jgi:CubicO group peptidase (beta-lactamase class C family)